MCERESESQEEQEEEVEGRGRRGAEEFVIKKSGFRGCPHTTISHALVSSHQSN